MNTHRPPARLLLLSLAISGAIWIVAPNAEADSQWAGTPGNWSSNSNPGWNGTGVPNAADAVAAFNAGSSATTTQDGPLGAGGNVTVGTIKSAGTSNASWTINANNSITFDVSSGSALIESSRSAVGGHRLNILAGGGSLILADDLIVRNTGSGNSILGSIQLNPNITGSGNITFDNPSSNNTAAGQIFLNNASSTSDFSGNVLVRRGVVLFNDKDQFGGKTSNVITLGEVAKGSVTLVSSTAAGTVVNNISVAADTIGATVLGSISAASTGSTIYSGTVSLNSDLSLTSLNTGSGFVSLSNTVSGTGSLTKTGAGIAQMSGVNAYTGNTTVSAGTLLLMAGGEQRFKIQDANISNAILGSGTLTLNSILRLDISGLTDSFGTWNLVDVGSLSETFGASFGLAFLSGPTFTDAGSGNFTSGNWSFSQSSGNLVLVPEPGIFGLMGVGGMFVAFRRRRAMKH